MADGRDPFGEDTPENDESAGSEDGDRYIPTPEEIESGDAPRVSDSSAQEDISEEPTGFFERFRMRRSKGVGRRRKYVSPEAQDDAGGGDDHEPPDSSSVAAGLGDESPDRDEGRAGKQIPAASEPQADADVEEVGSDAPEQIIEADEDKQKNEPDQPEDEGSGRDLPPTPARRVESVSFAKPREKKPEPKSDPALSLKEIRIARLFTVAEEHGHSMGELEPDLGSDNSSARCVDCKLGATLVGSRDDMSTYIRWDIRGPALERRCSS